MAERTDEQAREEGSSADTDELLAEVEALTEESPERDADSAPSDAAAGGVTDEESSIADRLSTGERSTSTERAGRGRTGGLRERADEAFSPRAFLVALVLSTVGLAVGGIVPLIGFLGGAIGIFGAAFALGVGSGEHRYVEAALAGGAVLGVSTFLNYLAFAAFAGAGFAPALLGVGAGLVLGLVGHYFGRDLRSGLTQEI